MYLLNLLNTDTGQRVSVPIWDEEWSDNRLKAGQPLHAGGYRRYLFKIGLGIPMEIALAHTDIQEEAKDCPIRIASVRIGFGKVAFSETGETQDPLKAERKKRNRGD